MTSHSKQIMDTVDYYDKHARNYYEATVQVDMAPLYKPFLELIPPGGKILDAGCGSGRDSLYFKKQGFEVTAFDASSELVRLSSELLKQEVLHLSFEEVSFQAEFDGVWACASLLHVPKGIIEGVLPRLADALKDRSILYASFKYGDLEVTKDGRYFNFYNETTFGLLVQAVSRLEMIRTWRTEDIREDRPGELWLNALLRKKEVQR